MNHSALQYTSDCCSKLEKIASKRKIYKSNSTAKLNQKDSKSNLKNGRELKEIGRMAEKIPFVCARSASKSHNFGINIQTTMSTLRQYREQNYDDSEFSNNSANHLLANNKASGTNLAQQFSDTQVCPAILAETVDYSEIDIFGAPQNPWSVRQSDTYDNVFECDHQNNICSCSTRFSDSYNKVMAPFLKHLKSKKNSPQTVANLYTKAKNVQYYERMSRRMQELKLAIDIMNNDILKLTKKYTNLYEQYVRNKNDSLAQILQQTEEKLGALKSQVEEACKIYQEGVYVNKQERLSQSIDIETECPKPKETNTVNITRALRRVQMLQDALKEGQFLCRKTKNNTKFNTK